MKKLTKLEQLEKDLFELVYYMGFIKAPAEEHCSVYQDKLQAYKDEVLRLEKQEEIEGMFREEMDSHIAEKHLNEDSCGYAGCPAAGAAK